MPDEVVEDTQGLAQFNRLLPEARALPDASVKTFRIDPVLARQNVTDGVQALLEVGEARLQAELPALDLTAVKGLGDLAIAVNYASRRAEQVVAPGSLKLLKEATATRSKLLVVAEAMAAAGLLPAAKVRKIRRGNGGIDRAQDCVDLAALFTQYAAAIRGKTPLTAAEIKRAGEVGAELLNVIKPKGSRRGSVSQEEREAAEDRDRLGTLLTQRYDQVRRAAGWIFGTEADEHVPPLGSTRRRRSKATPKPPQSST